MWAKRSEQLQDLSLVVGLDPTRCLDTADFLARHAARYGIGGQLEFRRNHSGRQYDRHYVLCHQAGQAPLAGGPPNSKPLWIMHFVVVPHSAHHSQVVLGLHSYRRWGRGVEGGRAARQYRELLGRALHLLDEQKQHKRPSRDNIIPLRPFIDLAPVASA